MDEADRQEKYIESVLKVPEFLKKSQEKSGAMVQFKNDRETKDCTSGENVDVDTSPDSSGSSESSTPMGSPTFSISCTHHSCGSLFAKCSQRGRWPLLQTFTNKESPLSRQTFSDSCLRPKSDNFQSGYSRNDQNNLKNPFQKLYLSEKQHPSRAVLRLSSENSSNRKNVEKKVTFAINLEKDQENRKERSTMRRHHSLPARRGISNDKFLVSSNKINRDPVSALKKSPLPNSQRENSKKMWGHVGNNRERSKSEGHIIVLKNGFEGKEGRNNLAENNCRVQYAKNTLRKDVNKDSSRAADVCSTDVTFLNNFVDSRKPQNLKIFQRNQCGLRESEKYAKDWARQIDFLETEILVLRKELKIRDQEKIRLQSEVHKLKSVLQETSIFTQEGDLLSSLQDSHGMPGQVHQVLSIPNPSKKQGISGESSNHGRNHDQIQIQRFDKDFRSKQLIKDAIMENDFLKNLDMSQVRQIVESVYPKEFSKGDYVLREGEAGSHLYVSAEGELEVIKENKVLGRMGPGKAFGELAILYNCRRTASIKVVSDAKVWVLDRRVFQQIMMKTGLQRLQENLNFLRSVPLLQSLSDEVLAKIADVLEVVHNIFPLIDCKLSRPLPSVTSRFLWLICHLLKIDNEQTQTVFATSGISSSNQEFYPSGEHIIRQGANGDTFFIISSGRVKVTQQKPGREEEEDIRILDKGDYFGEQALLKEDWRTANVIALSPGVECLTLDRDSFIQLIGDLSELQEKNYEDQVRGFSRPSSSSSLSDKQEYDYIRLEDLDVICTLGVGGFGRVELVQYAKNKSMTFALKCMKKQHIVETKQQEHVYSERNIMLACNSSFICRLYRTFRDSKYVYMLQEVLLGGEVWTILRERGYFDDYTTKFVTGCVVEAFEYLHARGIVYRDLKPENLMLDNTGYAKLVDFGFSKRLGFSSKTWTFCGTPEYLAPEIILNKGHDRAVDYWSLGILMHELLTGTPPFIAPDPMRTYNIILKGIDMVDFPKHITRAAQSLIKRLCRDAPSERLGYQRGGISDIKKHKWFQGFDWSGLKQRVLNPPITPLVRGPMDTSNFDSYSKDISVPPDEFSNWDAEF